MPTPRTGAKTKPDAGVTQQVPDAGTVSKTVLEEPRKPPSCMSCGGNVAFFAVFFALVLWWMIRDSHKKRSS